MSINRPKIFQNTTVFGASYLCALISASLLISHATCREAAAQKHSGGMQLSTKTNSSTSATNSAISAISANSAAAASIVGKADYLRAHGDIEKSIPYYTQAIKTNSKYEPAYIGRALAWEELGKDTNALADFTDACKLKGDYKNISFRHRGNLLQSLHKYNEAIADYSRVIEWAPTDGLYLSRAACYSKLNKHALALKDVNSAIEHDGKRSSVYEKRGHVYFAMKQFPKALADFNLTLKMDPDGNQSKDGHESLHRERAEIYKSMGKLDLAKKEMVAVSEGRRANMDLAPFATEMMK